MKFEYADAQTIDPKLRYRCRHIFTDGHRCGSPALRGQSLCFYHRTSAELPNVNNGARTPDEVHFTMPSIEDRSGIQLGISQVLARLACNAIDPKRASLLLYGLQIASANLPRHAAARPGQALPAPEPLVEDYTHCPDLGPLAPLEPLPTTTASHPEPTGVAAQPQHPDTQNPTATTRHPERSGEAAQPQDPETLNPTQTSSPFPPQNPTPHPEPINQAEQPKHPTTPNHTSNRLLPSYAAAEDPTIYPAFWDPANWNLPTPQQQLNYKGHDPYPRMAP